MVALRVVPVVAPSQFGPNLQLNEKQLSEKYMRILVIDDEKTLAATLAMILRNAGHEAAVAHDGPSALERAETFHPDCVISDVVLPGMNGIDTCGVIQSKYPKSHVLLFSGQAETNALVEEAHAKGYTWELLAKPVEPDELLEKLEFVERAAAGRAIEKPSWLFCGS